MFSQEIPRKDALTVRQKGIDNFLLKCYTIMVHIRGQRFAFSLEKLRKDSVYNSHWVLQWHSIWCPVWSKNSLPTMQYKSLQHSGRKLTIYITNLLFVDAYQTSDTWVGTVRKKQLDNISPAFVARPHESCPSPLKDKKRCVKWYHTQARNTFNQVLYAHFCNTIVLWR